MNDQELKDAISDMQECRELIGKANMRLNNILTQRKADMQKKLDDAYQKGLDDAWDAARKIVLDEGLAQKELKDIFDCATIGPVLRAFTASEAIAKIKAHEAGKDEIRVGDEVRRISDGVKYVVVDPKNEFGRVCGFSMNGIWYGECPNALRKTRRHFDVESILKEMSE